MCCLGKITGGDVVIPVLKQGFEFKPGDVLIFRSSY